MTVDKHLAGMMSELAIFWDNLLEKHYDNVSHFGTFDLRVYTNDGYTATFMEEGIEFYPKEEESK